jgi:hypothetical protein
MATERVLAVWELLLPVIREYAGVHELDGRVQDLSPAGVSKMLSSLHDDPRSGSQHREHDAHDEAHLAATEAGVRAVFGLTEHHRWNPLIHMMNLDLACYDRTYAPAAERAEARLTHAGAWPDAIASSIEALDEIPSPIARALLPAARGLAGGLDGLGDEPGSIAVGDAARAAHVDLVAHLESAAESGAPDFALGNANLARLLGDAEGTAVDLGQLEELSDDERRRLRDLLREHCERYRAGAGADPRPLVAELEQDHPDADGVIAAAQELITEATEFTLDHDLISDPGGECLVGPAPMSRHHAVAMMSWTGAYEGEAPAWYYVTPPDESWPKEEQQEWLSMFSATTLPAITVHEVTPGHFAHGRMILRTSGDVRRSLHSEAFIEGWAHYVEELMVEEGFRQEDPRFAIGVTVEALVRVTRFASALGIHRGTMTLQDAVRRFEEDGFLQTAGARAEAERAFYDPTYGRYTWGKLEIRKLRDEARAQWGKRYMLRRFHDSLLSLGAPPLGTMGDFLAAGVA